MRNRRLALLLAAPLGMAAASPFELGQTIGKWAFWIFIVLVGIALIGDRLQKSDARKQAREDISKPPAERGEPDGE